MSLLVRSLMPLIISAGLCLLISGAFFAFSGYTATVWLPFLLTMAGPMVLPFVLFPAGLLAGLWNAQQARPGVWVRLLALGSVAYIAAVLAATLALTAALSRNLPGDAPAVLSGMFVVAGAVAPWAVLALRDRQNQLFIVLLWALTVAAIVLLPLLRGAIVSPVGYAGLAWVVMMLVTGVEHLRQNRRAQLSK